MDTTNKVTVSYSPGDRTTHISFVDEVDTTTLAGQKLSDDVFAYSKKGRLIHLMVRNTDQPEVQGLG
jgi:hypothetical protein